MRRTCGNGLHTARHPLPPLRAQSPEKVEGANRMRGAKQDTRYPRTVRRALTCAWKRVHACCSRGGRKRRLSSGEQFGAVDAQNGGFISSTLDGRLRWPLEKPTPLNPPSPQPFSLRVNHRRNFSPLFLPPPRWPSRPRLALAQRCAMATAPAFTASMTPRERMPLPSSPAQALLNSSAPQAPCASKRPPPPSTASIESEYEP